MTRLAATRSLRRGALLSARGNKSTRRGTSLVETIVSAILLGTVFATVVPLLRLTAVEQNAADCRQLAAEELANLAERLSLEPWESITAESVAGRQLSDEAKRKLPKARLQSSLQLEEGPPPAKRISLELSWEDRGGKTTAATGGFKPVSPAPARLVFWRTRYEGAR
jgi:hypothetical protein